MPVPASETNAILIFFLLFQRTILQHDVHCVDDKKKLVFLLNNEKVIFW